MTSIPVEDSKIERERESSSFHFKFQLVFSGMFWSVCCQGKVWIHYTNWCVKLWQIKTVTSFMYWEVRWEFSPNLSMKFSLIRIVAYLPFSLVFLSSLSVCLVLLSRLSVFQSGRQKEFCRSVNPSCLSISIFVYLLDLWVCLFVCLSGQSVSLVYLIYLILSGLSHLSVCLVCLSVWCVCLPCLIVCLILVCLVCLFGLVCVSSRSVFLSNWSVCPYVLFVRLSVCRSFCLSCPFVFPVCLSVWSVCLLVLSVCLSV